MHILVHKTIFEEKIKSELRTKNISTVKDDKLILGIVQSNQSTVLCSESNVMLIVPA